MVAFGFGLGLGISPGTGGGRTLASIFGPGDNGFLLSPVTASHCWKDTAATDPVTADGDLVARVDDSSGKSDPGLQGTLGFRPRWKPNSGKPYLLPDGSDDRLLTTFQPPSALTMFIACRATLTGALQVPMGGGVSTGNKRAFIGFDTAGQILIGWGTAVAETGTPDRTGVNSVIVVAGTGASRDVYLNGVKLTFAAASGNPDSTGGALAVACYNNNGTQQTFSTAQVFGAGAINRQLSEAEILFVNQQMQELF